MMFQRIVYYFALAAAVHYADPNHIIAWLSVGFLVFVGIFMHSYATNRVVMVDNVVEFMEAGAILICVWPLVILATFARGH